MSDEVEKLLDSLTSSDIGLESVGDKIIRFEGFTDDCWNAAFEEGKTVDDIEKEIISDWGDRVETAGLVLLESGWWTPDIFYSVYHDESVKYAD